MKQTIALLGLIAVLQTGAAWADEDCFVPMADWQPRDAVQALAVQNGWTVRRIKIDDGCYEIDGYDANGRPIEVTVHPATLKVIAFEYEDDHVSDRQKLREKDRSKERDR